MSTNDAQQLAFDGMAPRKRRKRAPAEKIVAAEDPIAQVVLDVQATHLGQTFDYLVEERWSQTARPGVMVRVRFGGRLLNGVIWKRTAASATPRSALRFLERVISPHVLVSESMRDDITRIADAMAARGPTYFAWRSPRAWRASTANSNWPRVRYGWEGSDSRTSRTN